MPNLNTSLSISAGGRNFNFGNNYNYQEIFSKDQVLDSNDSFIKVSAFTPGTISANSLENAKYVCIYNPSNQTAEIRYTLNGWTAGTPDVIGSAAYVSRLLKPREYIVIPNLSLIDYSAGTSAGNGGTATLEKTEPNGKVNSTADLAGAISSTTSTSFTIDDGAGDGNYEEVFKVGDYIIIDSEVMLITAVTSDNSGTLTVDRGQLGSTAATHTDNTQVDFHFYNNKVDFDAHSVVQTDHNGEFTSTIVPAGDSALTHIVRAVTTSDGIVPGSLMILFYTKGGYQELGLSGISSSTNSGLTASTAYQFTIAADGGSAYDLSFTTDSSNLNFGGTNGVISKIQAQLDTQFYTTSSNLFEKRVTVAIVNGDLRFTSGSNLSTSAIALGDSSGGNTDIWGVGRFPAIANVEGAVSADVHDTTITRDGITTFNNAQMAMDGGYGNITGAATGTIDYETTAINLRNAPANAEMQITYAYDSALAGGVDTNNVIDSILARSTSAYRNSRIQLLAFN